MEANQENVKAPEAPETETPIADVPDFEQGMGTQNTSEDIGFNEMIGIPASPEETQAPEIQETPESVTQQNFSKDEVAPESNDQVRYQYWQSQAAKLQKQVDETKEYAPMVDYLRSNPEAVKNLTPAGQPVAGQETAPTSQETEEFPPPPERPEQPVGFSREESFTDPASASAKHLDAMDEWRDNMSQYNSLASQYQVAVMRESYDKKIKGLEGVEEARVKTVEKQEKLVEMRDFVVTNYDLGDKVDDFITTMNSPDSINMDDLVGYYKYKNGMTAGSPAQTHQNVPSSTFNQVKRAQSVPAPMGVQSAQTNATPDPNKGFMDLLINNDKQKNIL